MESWIGGIAHYLVERRYLLGLYIGVDYADQIMMMLVFTALTGTILQLFLLIGNCSGTLNSYREFSVWGIRPDRSFRKEWTCGRRNWDGRSQSVYHRT